MLKTMIRKSSESDALRERLNGGRVAARTYENHLGVGGWNFSKLTRKPALKDRACWCLNYASRILLFILWFFLEVAIGGITNYSFVLLDGVFLLYKNGI